MLRRVFADGALKAAEDLSEDVRQTPGVNVLWMVDAKGEQIWSRTRDAIGDL